MTRFYFAHKYRVIYSTNFLLFYRFPLLLLLLLAYIIIIFITDECCCVRVFKFFSAFFYIYTRVSFNKIPSYMFRERVCSLYDKKLFRPRTPLRVRQQSFFFFSFFLTIITGHARGMTEKKRICIFKIRKRNKAIIAPRVGVVDFVERELLGRP